MLTVTKFRISGLFCLGAAMLFCPGVAFSQHDGHGAGGGIPGGTGRPTGVDEKDSLKDFHHALAVEATSEQTAEFQALLKETDAARAKLQTLTQPQGKDGAESGTASGGELDQMLRRARLDSQKFVEGFSSAQKSGLKDLLKKLGKVDSDLEVEEKKLNESLAGNRSETTMASLGEGLTRSLKSFADEELALGREMGVVLAEESDLTFNLAEVKSPVNLGNQTLSLSQSGVISQVAAASGRHTLKLELIADLSDLKQNITELLRAHVDSGSGCGERLRIRNATIASSSPASVLLMQLHYERWSCLRVAGQTGPQELAEGDGAVEVRLTPVVEKGGSVKVTTEFSRIDAAGAMGESLRSGDLGDELREKLSDLILPVVRAGLNVEKSLPPAVRASAAVQSARFQDAGVGRFAIVFDGKLEVSDEQLSLMVSQLNQAAFAQDSAAK